MPESNQMYELTKLLDTRTLIETDLTDLLKSLQDTLREKYVSRLHSVVNTNKEKVSAHPPKEAALLRAMKEFAPQEHRPHFDRMIDMVLMMNTMQNMHSNLMQIAEQSRPPALSAATDSQGMMSKKQADLPSPSAPIAAEFLLALALLDKI